MDRLTNLWGWITITRIYSSWRVTILIFDGSIDIQTAVFGQPFKTRGLLCCAVLRLSFLLESYSYLVRNFYLYMTLLSLQSSLMAQSAQYLLTKPGVLCQDLMKRCWLEILLIHRTWQSKELSSVSGRKCICKLRNVRLVRLLQGGQIWHQLYMNDILLLSRDNR